ncbi:hypothetical protein FWK35_00012057 [Aphis craccivora]
MYLQ